jgi:hypothetical protein
MENRAALVNQPQFSEERRLEAEAADRELRRIVASMQEGLRSIQRMCAEAVNAPHESDPNLLIWHGIAEFANTDVGRDEELLHGYRVFRHLLILCEIRPPGLDFENPLDLSFRDLDLDSKLTGRSIQDALIHRIRELHEDFRLMALWLADPGSCGSAQRHRALDLLLEHGPEWAVHSHISVNDDFAGAPLFYWKSVDGYQTIMTPVARFILKQIELYQDGPLELEEAVPIKVCKRPECRKIIVPRRATKDFCSSSCRTLHRQKVKREAWAAYMREYREKNYKKPSR